VTKFPVSALLLGCHAYFYGSPGSYEPRATSHELWENTALLASHGSQLKRLIMEKSGITVAAKAFFRLLNNYFGKVYVLTVASSTGRQKEFAAAMEGLNYQFFYGTDRNTLKIEELEEKGIYDQALSRKAQRYGKSMTTSEIACSLGHCHIYEDIIENNIQRALIFEDDVFPLLQNIPLFEEMLKALPSDWEIFYLDFNKNEKVVPFKRAIYHVQHFLGFLKMKHRMISNLFPRKQNKYWQKAGFHDYTDAYAVTLEAAKKLRELQKPVTMTSDNLLANAITNGHLKGYIPVPKIVAQKSVGDSASIESMIERFVKD
jgi:glycosyl transferase family 25